MWQLVYLLVVVLTTLARLDCSSVDMLATSSAGTLLRYRQVSDCHELTSLPYSLLILIICRNPPHGRPLLVTQSIFMRNMWDKMEVIGWKFCVIGGIINVWCRRKRSQSHSIAFNAVLKRNICRAGLILIVCPNKFCNNNNQRGQQMNNLQLTNYVWC